MAKSLILGIGMNKTGTASLQKALNILGFNCLHWARKVKTVARQNKRHGKPPLHSLDEEYNAFCDSPINYMFRELDAAYPGSKFILTVRDMDPWIISRMSQFGGSPALHRRKWDEHTAAVYKHFAERQDDLLVYDVCGGDGWEPLCAFLNLPVPDRTFPWVNRTGKSRLRRFAEKLSREGPA